jgi:hypothetical protein
MTIIRPFLSQASYKPSQMPLNGMPTLQRAKASSLIFKPDLFYGTEQNKEMENRSQSPRLELPQINSTNSLKDWMHAIRTAKRIRQEH